MRTWIIREHERGTHLDRTMELAQLARAGDHIPELVRELYGMLGDLFPPEQETRLHQLPASEKQLGYISHLAALDWDTSGFWREHARAHGLDMAQAGHLIGKLLAQRERIPA